MSDAASAVERIAQLESELADARAELERARAATPVEDSPGKWRRMQEENVHLRAERERLEGEAAALRVRVRHTMAGPESSGGSLLDILKIFGDS